MMIPCSSDCFFQQDGCCRLQKTGAVTNYGPLRCPHYIDRSIGRYLPPKGSDPVGRFPGWPEYRV